jgi:hypothetical protein
MGICFLCFLFSGQIENTNKQQIRDLPIWGEGFAQWELKKTGTSFQQDGTSFSMKLPCF